MKLFLAYLRLIRPFNLIMIALTLYMVRFFFVYTAMEFPKLHPRVSELTYALFSFSFICMAASGYIINDYYDIEIDKINKPGKVIVGNTLTTRSALIAYWIISIGGISTGFVSCSLAGIPLLGVLFLFYLVALWFYSYKLKSTFLIGNILIGLCIALVPLGGACIELAVPVYDSLQKTITPEGMIQQALKPFIRALTIGVSVFAFLSTVIREIVKDVEDIEGDASAGCRTMPIVIGITKTKWVIASLLIILNVLLDFIQYELRIANLYPLLYFLLFIQAPFLVILYKLKSASSALDFDSISRWLKVLMFMGIIYVFGVAFYAYSIFLSFSLIVLK